MLCQIKSVTEAESDLLENTNNTGLMQFVKHHAIFLNYDSDQEQCRHYFSHSSLA